MREINLLFICFLLLALTGCRGGGPAIEKRYVTIEIPEYTAADYIDLLVSPDPDLRYMAIVNLVNLKAFNFKEQPDLEALPQKLESLLEDASPKVRAAAAYWVKSVKTNSFKDVLIKLTDDPSSAVRLDAVSALGPTYLGSPDVVDAVLESLDDKSILVRLQAIEEFRGCKCKESALRNKIIEKLLIKLPEAGRIEQLKIIQTLGMIGDGPGVELALIGMLDSGNEKMITASVRALGQQKSAAAVKRFPGLLALDFDRKKVIVDALSAIDTPESTQILVELLNAGDPKIKKDVINALGKTEGEVGLEIFVKEFNAQSEELLKETDLVKWIGFDPDKSGIPLKAIKKKVLEGKNKSGEALIIELLESKNDYERMIGLELLMEEGFNERIEVESGTEGLDFFPHLERLANDPSVMIRVMCFQFLGDSIDPRAFPLLEKALEDPFLGIRWVAFVALGKRMESMATYANLRQLYKMKDKLVPTTYTEEDIDFGMLLEMEMNFYYEESDKRTRQRRVGELSSASAPTRLIAAGMLAEEGDEAGIPVLLDFLENGTVGERRAALEMFEEFPSAPTSIEDLTSQLEAIKAKQEDMALAEEIGEMIQALQSEEEDI